MKSFCVIGLGKFGQSLAVELAKEKNQVMVIDVDSTPVNALADVVTNAVVGDPTNEAVLKASGVADYECAIIGFSDNINDSILITLMLKELGVPKVVARAANDRQKKVLERIGADMVVFPERDMGEKLANMLSKKNVLEYFEFADEYSIVEIHVPEKWVGKDMIELRIRQKYSVTVIAVRNRESGVANVSPDPTSKFEPGDIIAIMGKEEDIDRITNNI